MTRKEEIDLALAEYKVIQKAAYKKYQTTLYPDLENYKPTLELDWGKYEAIAGQASKALLVKIRAINKKYKLID